MHAGLCYGKTMEIYHYEDLSVDGKIILKWALQK